MGVFPLGLRVCRRSYLFTTQLMPHSKGRMSSFLPRKGVFLQWLGTRDLDVIAFCWEREFGIVSASHFSDRLRH